MSDNELIEEGLCPQCGHIEDWNDLGCGIYECPECGRILEWEDTGEWKVQEDTLVGDPDERLYVDYEGNPITGILENYYYFKEGDPKNNAYVKEGKR